GSRWEFRHRFAGAGVGANRATPAALRYSAVGATQLAPTPAPANRCRNSHLDPSPKKLYLPLRRDRLFPVPAEFRFASRAKPGKFELCVDRGWSRTPEARCRRSRRPQPSIAACQPAISAGLSRPRGPDRFQAEVPGTRDLVALPLWSNPV